MKPSAWVTRWASQIPVGGRVLDLACGTGRHSVFLAERGYQVDAVDQDTGLSAADRDVPGIRWLEHDLEREPWPFAEASYEGIVVINYLHRPLLTHVMASLVRGGVLIYETFAMGQEQFGRPRNPAHLLMPGELLELVRGTLKVVAYEDVMEASPSKRVQRLCAVRP